MTEYHSKPAYRDVTSLPGEATPTLGVATVAQYPDGSTEVVAWQGKSDREIAQRPGLDVLQGVLDAGAESDRLAEVLRDKIALIRVGTLYDSGPGLFTAYVKKFTD